MRHFVDPRQISLFDSFVGVFSPLARRRLENGWPAVFRAVLLELMPVRPLAGHFHPTHGRPTKELYSVAGQLFLQESFDWTNAEACLFRSDVWFALNLQPGVDELCDRTLERHRARFIDDDLAGRAIQCGRATPRRSESCFPGRSSRRSKRRRETCGENEVQLIVGAIPKTAAEHDANAVAPMLGQLEEQGFLPESLLADTAYGSDENVEMAAAMGVEMVSPVSGPTGEGKPAETTPAGPETTPPVMEPLSIDDFAIDERTGKVGSCPSGRIPLRVIRDEATGTTT